MLTGASHMTLMKMKIKVPLCCFFLISILHLKCPLPHSRSIPCIATSDLSCFITYRSAIHIQLNILASTDYISHCFTLHMVMYMKTSRDPRQEGLSDVLTCLVKILHCAGSFDCSMLLVSKYYSLHLKPFTLQF